MLGGWAEGAGTSERAWPAPCPQGPASACRGSCSPGPGRCSPDCPRHTSHSSSRLSAHARSSPSCQASLAPAPSRTRGTWRPGCPAPGSGPARPPCPPSPLSAQSQSWTPPRRFPRETCHSSWRDYTCSVQPEKLCMFPGTTIQFRVTFYHLWCRVSWTRGSCWQVGVLCHLWHGTAHINFISGMQIGCSGSEYF